MRRRPARLRSPAPPSRRRAAGAWPWRRRARPRPPPRRACLRSSGKFPLPGVRPLDAAKDVHRDPWVDRELAAVLDGGGEQAVEPAVVPGFRLDGAGVAGHAERAPVLPGLVAEAVVAGPGTVLERRLLRVQAPLGVAGLLTADVEPRPGHRRETGHEEPGPGAVLVGQHEERVVVALSRAAAEDVGVHLLDRPEQLARLVDEVGAEVEQDPATAGDARGRLPVPRALRLPPLEAGLG